MLEEIRNPSQHDGEPFRRWFSDSEMDLIIWIDESGSPIGFQLCYDKPVAEKALTWRQGRGFSHSGVDGGENRPGRHKGTPLLVADGEFDATRILERFRQRANRLQPELVKFVTSLVESYPNEI